MGDDTELVLTIDPGDVTGWSLWVLAPGEAIYRLDFGLIKGGVDGFVEWMIEHARYLHEAIVVCEKFVPERNGEVMTPLLIEGALVCAQHYAAAPEIVWQLRVMKRSVGPTSADRDDLLRAHGLFLTGREEEIDWKDARDVNDAALHALIFARDYGHEPTMRAFWPEHA